MAAGASDGLEYARGEPKTVEVEDNGQIKVLPYIKSGTYAIVEGDIVIGDASQIAFAAQSGPIRLTYKNAAGASEITPFGYVARSVLSGQQKWPNSVVPYVIDPKLASGATVLKAMAAWSAVTALKFQERTAANAGQYPNYVYFTVGSNPLACLSMGVGMMGGEQNVELVDGCAFGQIVHEIGHVIGLHHEQNRTDRASHVRVQFTNIIRGYGGQFRQYPADFADAGSYDLDSIMHYGAYAFSCNNQPTIVATQPLPPGTQIGQRDHISKGDAAVVNSIYK
ncbi:M12 family metallopeptidase [Bradyrhizobium ontarionense]|uniref:M12 family metallopeptidase n=1 Tax=Bradyrhizobium ontarionense TaxID=2898149 RepID=A0ABY3RHB0_9BRAD|nr:M12 family metallopeptidase [Bradyrhizobium sp. A19]UFZ06357.1 M12 family metallopeptidase [Bradyrhizobium sp. A19]